MPALIRPGSVNVITQEGEVRVSITLDLNIYLHGDTAVGTTQPKTEEASEKTDWMIPDFGTSPKVAFGKKE